jgi:hypothetical protein
MALDLDQVRDPGFDNHSDAGARVSTFRKRALPIVVFEVDRLANCRGIRLQVLPVFRGVPGLLTHQPASLGAPTIAPLPLPGCSVGAYRSCPTGARIAAGREAPARAS